MTRFLQLQQGVSAPNRTRSTQFFRSKAVPLAWPEHRFADRIPSFRRVHKRQPRHDGALAGDVLYVPPSMLPTGALRFANDVSV